MFATCSNCKKRNDYWSSRSEKEPIILNGKTLHGAFSYSKYFCPLRERKIPDKNLLENQEKFLIFDCLNGDREEIREKPILPVFNHKIQSDQKINNTDSQSDPAH